MVADRPRGPAMGCPNCGYDIGIRRIGVRVWKYSEVGILARWKDLCRPGDRGGLPLTRVGANQCPSSGSRRRHR